MTFVSHIKVKTKSNHKFLNFVFQFMKNTKWHFDLPRKSATCLCTTDILHFLTVLVICLYRAKNNVNILRKVAIDEEILVFH